MSASKTIVICPLNWGLGHATRCVPVIHSLLKQGHRVLIAAGGESANWLQHQFPNLTILSLPNLNIQYSTFLPQSWAIASQFVKLKRHQNENKKLIDKYVDQYAIDVIISDNCFGCYSSKTLNIYMTHQLNIQGIGSILANKWHHKEISNYDHVWVVDALLEKDSIAQELAKPPQEFNLPTTKIGLLSHLENTKLQAVSTYEYELLVLLSGPETQRTVLLENALKLGRLMPSKIAICGALIPEKIDIENNIALFPKLNSEDLLVLIQKSKNIVMRSGYSSLMDFSYLNREAWVLPTPGQTEQEYLHRHCTTLLSTENDLIAKNAVKVFPNLKRFKPKPYLNSIPNLISYYHES